MYYYNVTQKHLFGLSLSELPFCVVLLTLSLILTIFPAFLLLAK